MITGRQMAFRIFEHFSRPNAQRSVLDIGGLVHLEFENDDHVRAKRSSNYSSNRPRLELLLALEALPSELSER